MLGIIMQLDILIRLTYQVTTIISLSHEKNIINKKKNTKKI